MSTRTKPRKSKSGKGSKSSSKREEPLRVVRERALVAATRALFDERGMQDAPIEEIARAVGIARGLVYRHFSSKEELFVLTLTDYLDELATALEAAAANENDPIKRLERTAGAFAAFCERYPAFLDCALSLMRRPAMELNAIVSESVWLRLGRSMGRCIGHLAQILRDGAEAGIFDLEDSDYTANLLWTQTLGAMHLARIRVAMRQGEGTEPELFKVDPADVVRSCVASALATVGAKR